PVAVDDPGAAGPLVRHGPVVPVGVGVRRGVQVVAEEGEGEGVPAPEPDVQAAIGGLGGGVLREAEVIPAGDLALDPHLHGEVGAGQVDVAAVEAVAAPVEGQRAGYRRVGHTQQVLPGGGVGVHDPALPGDVGRVRP